MNNEESDYEEIPSKDAKIPTWLKLIYITLPIWGVVSFYFFWNGSHGWMDRGHWQSLEKAANTTFTNTP